ncbi:hypothetical protein ACFWBX_33200 [Streptomyces sp. NPDC059991]|uniref:hypothetical protein n=1 Tax=Streptomyces sp. NPDC059991 TaxID=3347028 RepID=UPI0036B5DC82
MSSLTGLVAGIHFLKTATRTRTSFSPPLCGSAAQTSPHLSEQLTGGRDFITATLGALLQGEVTAAPAKPTVFSPFGLGILDVAVGHRLLGEARRRGSAVEIPDFIGEATRW